VDEVLAGDIADAANHNVSGEPANGS